MRSAISSANIKYPILYPLMSAPSFTLSIVMAIIISRNMLKSKCDRALFQTILTVNRLPLEH